MCFLLFAFWSSLGFCIPSLTSEVKLSARHSHVLFQFYLMRVSSHSNNFHSFSPPRPTFFFQSSKTCLSMSLCLFTYIDMGVPLGKCWKMCVFHDQLFGIFRIKTLNLLWILRSSLTNGPWIYWKPMVSSFEELKTKINGQNLLSWLCKWTKG